MSVEKLDIMKVRQEQKPYTMHLNSVLQNLKDPLSLAIWVYLSSLPLDWKIHRTQLQKHFGVGRDRVDHALSFLNKSKLIEYVQNRNDHSQFSESFILVKNGDDFISDGSEKAATLKNRCPGFPLPGKTATTNNIYNTNKEYNTNIREAGVPASQVCLIFDHWKSEIGKPKAVLDSKRETAIRNRLKDYSPEDIKLAIQGAKISPYHAGENPQKKKYQDIELICRNSKQIEEFIDWAKKTSSGKSALSAEDRIKLKAKSDADQKAAEERSRAEGEKQIAEYMAKKPSNSHLREFGAVLDKNGCIKEIRRL